ncbi:MAG: putative transcription regulator protein [Hyphomicrobiales bacterium]|jgi:DNA-binding MarR family transcriptional regulator|nr:putative transcription regulator protein [Hyphomicrobiales bacterium]
MSKASPELSHTPNGAAVTDLFRMIFLVNARLIADGDQLGRDLGFTSARWQVLGTAGDKLKSVAQLARQMGLARQSVQRLVDWLEERGFVVLVDNPDHQRAKLVQLTEKGVETRSKLKSRQIAWVNELGLALSGDDLETALNVLIGLRQGLDKARPARKPKAV